MRDLKQNRQNRAIDAEQETERGAERALFLRRTAETSAEMRVFLNSAQKIRRTENFRRTQNGAEREAQPKSSAEVGINSN